MKRKLPRESDTEPPAFKERHALGATFRMGTTCVPWKTAAGVGRSSTSPISTTSLFGLLAKERETVLINEKD